MAYAEKRGKRWRARWRAPDGTLESKPGFRTRKEAEKYGRDQEAAIRDNTYVDPRAGRITLTEWVNQWYPAQDLELNTLSTYKYLIEVHILPTFGGWSLQALELQPEAVALWEKQIVARGYTRRTARGARSTLATILADAMPRYIRSNPAARKRGKGRKGQRRIERAEQAEKTWAAPLEVLLFAARRVRPAADGRYSGRRGRHAREPWPVLVDMSAPWPGRPLPPWPPAQPGVPFTPPAGRGIRRLAGKEGTGRCPACNLTVLLRRDGLVISHKASGVRCPGSGQELAEPVPVASWRALRSALTPHGLRHGHETWLDDLDIRYVLQSERMGHEVPGMRGVYSHITAGMREDLTAGLQELWEASLQERARISTRSPVPVLDAILAGFRERTTKIGSHSAPKMGHLHAREPGRRREPGL